MKENPKQTNRKVILSQKKPMPMKYRVIKVEQLKQIKKKKIDAASTAVQSQKKADDVAPKVAATVNKKRNDRKSSYTSTSKNSNTNTTSENGDKYKNVAKMNMFQKNASSETSKNVALENQRSVSLAKQHTVSSETHNKKAEKLAVNTSSNSTFNTEIAKNSIKRESVQSHTVSDASNPPSSQTANYKAKAAEISQKMMTDVNKARSQTDAYEKSMKAFAIQQARSEYKKAHLSPNMSKRFRSAAQRMEAKTVNNDPNFNKYKKQATIHYKKMVKYDRVSRRLGNKIVVKEQKTERNEKILKVVKGAATLATNPIQFAKNAAEEQLRKSKIADTAFKISDDIKTFEDAAKADSLANGTSAAMTALPEKYVKAAVKDKVTNVLTGRDKTNKLKKKKAKADRKYGREARKAERAERKANRAKEVVRRNAKLKWYKEKKGLSKTGEIVKDIKKSAKKVGINILGLMVKAVKKGSAAVIAAVGPAFFVLLILLMAVSSLFTWLEPHEETFYNEAENTWEPVMVETNDEVLKGYIRHIRDYFDKKQLEILEVIDINFDGFTPDKYDYAKMEDKGGVLNFEDKPKLTTEYTLHYIENTVTFAECIGYSPGSRYSPGQPIWGEAKTKRATSDPILRTEYYKNDYDLGYEVRSTSLDYDFSRIYLLYAIDIEAYLNSLTESDGVGSGKGSDNWEGPIYSCDNGKFSVQQDITDEQIIIRKKGATIYEGSVVSYILSNPKLFEHTVPTASIPSNCKKFGSTLEWKQETKIEIISDEQYVFTNYIWNLYEYGNQWIKISDDCDFEHIIAMAAIKKWQEIEADGFDANTYTFEITDDDLDYCLDNLYEFYYSYRTGRCRNDNCHKYITGDPPRAQYTCNRATTHKHLIGQVTNYELIGGIDFALNKILKMPKRSDYSSDEEYNTAKAQFETDKEIYEVYAEYISDELGTSTKLPDYENDRDAQYRLLRMHQAGNGKKPSNPPTNVQCSVRKEIQSEAVTGEDATGGYTSTHEWTKEIDHFYLDVSWDAPAPEEYAKDKFVEISGYHIYAYNRSTGSKKLIGQTSSTSCSIDYISGKYKRLETEEEEIERADGSKITVPRIKKEKYLILDLPQYTHIVVEAYNDGGNSPQTDPLYVIIK